MTSVAGVVDAAAARLRAGGFEADEARRDAVVIARGLLRWTMTDWLAHSRDQAPPHFQTAFAELVTRRGTREPVAYLLGAKEFYGRTFSVTSDTLIPRPETEGLVDAALDWLRGRAAHTPGTPRVLDVGTGTGCLAITLALEAPAPGAIVMATDISNAALAVARDNAARLGATAVEFHHGHLLADVEPPMHLIVSNPPYVPARDRDTLSPDVGRFEPAQALFAGDDGLDVIRELVPLAKRALAPDGCLMMEIGAGQADAVIALIQASGFQQVQQAPDLQGIPRVIIAS
jgi:release factor glutamine methyltransferase